MQGQLLMENLFCIPAAGIWHGLSPKLTSIFYSGYFATPDPRKKCIVKLYKLRWHAISFARKGMCEVSRGLLSPLAVQQVHRRGFRSFLWCMTSRSVLVQGCNSECRESMQRQARQLRCNQKVGGGARPALSTFSHRDPLSLHPPPSRRILHYPRLACRFPGLPLLCASTSNLIVVSSYLVPHLFFPLTILLTGKQCHPSGLWQAFLCCVRLSTPPSAGIETKSGPPFLSLSCTCTLLNLPPQFSRDNCSVC